MHCSQCGAAMAEGAKFCGACGAAVAGSAIGGRAAAKPKPTTSETAKGCLIFAVLLLVAFFAIKACTAPSAEEQAASAAKEAEDKRKGFHCLSDWDGSSQELVRQVKAQLRDPESFEHAETLIAPVKNGQHAVTMRYRARNGFGGMNVGTAIGTISNAGCAATLVSAGAD